jgi:hypothetical protein
VVRIPKAGKCVRRDRVTARNGMEDGKQLLADCADVPKCRGSDVGARRTADPLRQLGLTGPPIHILGTLQMVYPFRRVRSKCHRVDEIERQVSGDELKSVILALHGFRFV